MNPATYLRIGLAILLAAALAYATHLVYKAGGDAREAAWLKREATMNAEAAAEVVARAKAVQEAYAAGSASIHAAATQYLEENQHVHAENDRLNACLRNGTCGMRVKPAQRADGTPAVPDPPRAVGQCDAAPEPDLPPETAIALRNLAAEADEVVRQLTLAQGEIRTIRQACTTPGTPPG